MRSFRLRLLLGSLVWTLALLVAAHVVFMTFLSHVFPIVHQIILIAALLTMLAGAMVVCSALIPFRRLRSQLLELRDGRRKMILGVYPTEIKPLIDDLNELLEQREHAVQRAQAKAGDLAHGLKTPLAILSQEAERAVLLGNSEMAETMFQQIERMRRQIEYHLAQARAGSAGGPGIRSAVGDTADALFRTLRRLYPGRDLSWDLEVSGTHSVRVRREDLEEILGNLLDNACKWAQSKVLLSSRLQKNEIVIVIEDDGPGIGPSLRNSVLQRGMRVDQATPGSGLGLAIVSNLVELYGGTISLDDSTLSGLRVSVVLPSAG
jgi:signal transduction histidine kinase